MLSHFRVIEHTVRGQHARHWPGGVEPGHHNALKLAVKQYVPLDQDPQEGPRVGDVTIIAAHANGFPKEMYEPMWDDLYEQLKQTGKKIGGIWIADVVHQGESGVLNEASLGNDPSWWDHARDLLYLINQKQDQMPQPLIGIGHSVGAAQLAHLSLLHPNLFQSLVLMDPTIQTQNPGKAFAAASTYRRDTWPSRAEAEQKFRASKFYQAWEDRVFEKWMEFGLKDLPPETQSTEDSDARSVPVALKTPKAQEVFFFVRPTYKGILGMAPSEDKETYGDMHPEDVEPGYPFYRPESAWLFRKLPEVHPSVLYVFGGQSPVSSPESREAKLSTTGTGIGGSGGRDRGKVNDVVLDCGHLVPMEQPKEAAHAIAPFVAREVDKWDEARKAFERKWKEKPRTERISIDDEWREKIGSRKPKPDHEKAQKSSTPLKSSL